MCFLSVKAKRNRILETYVGSGKKTTLHLGLNKVEKSEELAYSQPLSLVFLAEDLVAGPTFHRRSDRHSTVA